MRNFLVIIFLICMVFGAYADEIYRLFEKKSITIKHIGDQDAPLDIIIINTYQSGYLRKFHVLSYFYFQIADTLFVEIMDLINENMELLYEENRAHEYGCFVLQIKDGGEKYDYYLNERASALIFFNKFNDLFKAKRNYGSLNDKLESLIKAITIS